MENINQNEKPKWMSDPLVADIDTKKLEFLQDLVFETRGKSHKELLSFFMNVVKRGKANHITFTESEMAAIFAAIKSNSTPEELAQINKFMEMHKKTK